MAMKSTPEHYGRVAVTLHWSIAVLILVALATGFTADAIGNQAHGVLRAHIASGLLASLLTLVRIGWWWLVDTRPDPAPNTDGMKGRMARIVHLLLMIVPLGMMASGIGMMVLSGAAEQLFVTAQTALPEFETLSPRGPHGIGARVLVAMIIVHAGAALYHHLALRDGLIRRMAFSNRS